MCKGFMRVSREIVDWGWYKDSNTFRVFFHLLMNAQYKDGEFLGHKIHKGQVVTGRAELSQKLNISERSVRTALEHLKSTNNITIESTNKFSIVTICNFDGWQCGVDDNDQQESDNSDQQPTSNRPATDQQPTTYNKEIIEELKKEINILKERLTKVSPKKEQNFVPPTVVDVAAYIQEKGYHFDAESFVSFYESKGWMIGKNRMKDWRSACRTWENKKKEQEPSLFSQPQFPPNPRHGDKFGNNEWFYSGEEERWIKNGEVDRRGRVFIVQAGKWCV